MEAGTNLKWAAVSDKQLNAEDDLVTWICSAMKSYTVVSSPHFINLLSGLNRRYNIPSEKVIRTSLILKLYVKVQYKLKEAL